jgi:hypothetical protein
VSYLLSFVSVGQTVSNIWAFQFSLVLQFYAKWSLQYKLVVIVFPVQRTPNLPQFCVFVLGLVLGLLPCLQHIQWTWYGEGWLCRWVERASKTLLLSDWNGLGGWKFSVDIRVTCQEDRPCWLGICFCAIFDKKQLSCLLTYFAILLVIFLQKFICTLAQLTDHRWVLVQLQGVSIVTNNTVVILT